MAAELYRESPSLSRKPPMAKMPVSSAALRQDWSVEPLVVPGPPSSSARLHAYSRDGRSQPEFASSGRTTRSAPARAASRIAATERSRLASGSPSWMAYWAQATRTLRSFLPEVLYLSLEDLDRALRRLEEQSTLGSEVRGPPLQHLPEPLYTHQLPQGAVQRPPVVEDGAEVVDPLQLDV